MIMVEKGHSNPRLRHHEEKDLCKKTNKISCLVPYPLLGATLIA